MLDNNERFCLRTALDDAVFTVAQEQWYRLTGDIQSLESHIYAARAVENSLSSLARLQNRGIPNYDEWDALLYLTWYQPRQINLAYSVIRQIKQNWYRGKKKWWSGDLFWLGSGRVRVIDFGCGALAMLIAISIAAADSIIYGHDKPEIQIDCIDKSPAMIFIGQRIWSEFVNLIKVRFHKHPLCDIVDGVCIKTHSNISTIEDSSSDRPCYVSAIHCAYEDNIDDLENMISRVTLTHNPIVFLMTTHSSKKEVLNQLFPNNNINRYLEILKDTPTDSQFKGKLLRTTEWRNVLLSKLLRLHEMRENCGVDFQFLNSYLSNTVSWTCNDSVSRVYVRQDIDQLSPEQYPAKPEADYDFPF